jgi:hypothetical protein
MLNGRGAGTRMSKMAISLVDKAGNTLQRALVNDDGSCELSEEALSSAQVVSLEPLDMSLRAHEFRRLVDIGDVIDVAALLTVATFERPNARTEGPSIDDLDHHHGPKGQAK